MRYFHLFFILPIVFVAFFFLPAHPAFAMHEDWHDCIAVTGTTQSEHTPNAGSILFDELSGKGQSGETDEVFDDASGTFTRNYPNATAYRTCIDTDRYNQTVAYDDFLTWRYALRGWAYDDNLGWISFHCEDWAAVPGAGDVCSATGDYKTEIDFLGYLHGYAWSVKAGWLQFDWDISSCGNLGTYTYVSGDATCPQDGYFYNEMHQSIPEGRAYNDWQNRLGAGAGHFNGYAWNSSLGWFDFTDAWAVENGEPWYPAHLDVTARIVNKNNVMPYATSSRDKRGLVLADNQDTYRAQVQIWLEDHSFVGSEVAQIFIDPLLFGGVNDATKLQQVEDAGGSSIAVRTDSSGNFVYDSEYFTVGDVLSSAPTSNMNGVDMDGDLVIDILNDRSEKYFYTVQKLLLSDVDFQNPLFDTLPFHSAIKNGVYFDPSGLSVGLKFSPAVTVSKITNEGEYFINTSRNRATPFEVVLKKELAMNLNDPTALFRNFKVELGLGVDGSDFRFVFDTDSSEDYSYSSDSSSVEWQANTAYSKALSGLTKKTWNNQWTPWLKNNVTTVIEIIGMPVLKQGASAESRVADPIFSSKISYKNSGTPISFYGPNLGVGLSEDVYNPTLDVTSGIVNVRDIVNVQEGDSLFTVGDIRTNVVRSFLHRNVKEILSSANPPSGGGKVTQAGQTGGLTVPVSGGEMYYFVDGDVTIVNSDGLPTPPGNYANVGFSKERTIVVFGGNIFINANIAVDSGNAQVGIIAFHGSDGKGGNIYVHPRVTNIRAIVYADGVMAGMDGVLGAGKMITKEIGEDWNGDGNFSTQYSVPPVKDFTCGGVSAPFEDIFQNQMVFTGVLAASANTIGGTDSDPLRIGTGDVFEHITTGRIIEMVKQHDFNYFRSFKLVLERSDKGLIHDQQCGKWYNSYENVYYDNADGTVVARDVTGCGIEQKPVSEGGDLKNYYEGTCGVSAPAKGADAFDISYKYSPFIVVYEAISPTLPVFSLSGADSEMGRSVNR